MYYLFLIQFLHSIPATFRWHLMAPKEGTEVVTPRHSHSAVVHNSLIWIFGGIDTKGRKNDLWTWDFGRLHCPPVSIIYSNKYIIYCIIHVYILYYFHIITYMNLFSLKNVATIL